MSSPLEVESYTEFSLRVHGAATPWNRQPITGSIEVTRRCNFSCVHCYNNLPAGDEETRRRELSVREYERILDEIADAGTLWLLLTGGEIFVRPDFMEIYRYAKRKGFLITLFTNGAGITAAVADELAEWRPFAIEITLYGHTKETYEKLTRTPGSHARVHRAIELLMERDLPLKLKTVVLKGNRHELWDMKRFAKDLGVEFKFDAVINPRLDGSPAPLATRLEAVDVVELDLLDRKRVEEWGTFCEHFNGPPQPKGRENHLYHCGGAINSFSIDPYGGLGLCNFSTAPEDLYDLRKGSFREGWERFLLSVVERRITRTTKCTHCHIKALCGMCPAYGQLEAGDPEEPVDFLCHVAHLRARVLGLEIPEHGDCEYCPGGRFHDVLTIEVERLLTMTEDAKDGIGVLPSS